MSVPTYSSEDVSNDESSCSEGSNVTVVELELEQTTTTITNDSKDISQSPVRELTCPLAPTRKK